MKELPDIASPCLNICKLDAHQTVCVGCYRTHSEIGEWSRASNIRKQEIIHAASERQDKMNHQ